MVEESRFFQLLFLKISETFTLRQSKKLVKTLLNQSNISSNITKTPCWMTYGRLIQAKVYQSLVKPIQHFIQHV